MNMLKTFGQKFNNDWSMNLAGMLAYSLITAIFPILLAILFGASLVLDHLSHAAYLNVVTNITNALGNVSKVISVNALLNNLKSLTGPLAIVSVAGLVWTGSNLFTNMENAFSVIYRTGDRDFLHQKIMAVGMVILLAILLPLSLTASSLVTAGSHAFASLAGPLGIVLTFVGPLVSLAILWALFLAMYIVVPNIKVSFRDAWRGAATAAVLFAIFQLLFPLYFKLFLNGNAKYGAIAAAALLLIIWLWFFALITMIGAQINAVAMGIRPTRYDLARTLCEDYHAQQPATPSAQPASQRSLRSPVKPSAGAAGVNVKDRASSGGLGRVLTLPLRVLLLACWMAARPFMRGRDRPHSGRGDVPTA